jgi:hypothetical protein
METVYTKAQIKETWDEYQKAKAWRILREGKWKLYTKSPDTTNGATKATMVNVKDHISFPKYMELYNA